MNKTNAILLCIVFIAGSVMMTISLSDATPDESVESVYGIPVIDSVDGLSTVNNNIVLIESDGYEFSNSSSVRAVSKQIANGVKVVTSDLQLIERATAPIFSGFSTDADVYAVYFDEETGASNCISIISDNEVYIQERLEEWMDEIETEDASVSQIPGYYAGKYAICSEDSHSIRGETEITSYYYFADEDDPRYNYFIVDTKIKATAYASYNMCNNVDYINSVIDIEGADVGDSTVLDYGPTSTDSGPTFSISAGFPFGVSITLNYEANSVESDYDEVSGILEINQDYADLLSLKDIVKNTGISYSVVVDTEGPNGYTDYYASETFTTGLKYLSPYEMKSQFVMEVNVHVTPNLEGERFWSEQVQ